MNAIEYEQQGFIKGASAKVKFTGYKVVLVSSPKVDVDGVVKAWAAMEFDTHVRFLASLDDLELTT